MPVTSLVDLPAHYSLATMEERLSEGEEFKKGVKSEKSEKSETSEKSEKSENSKGGWIVSSSIDYTVSVMELKDECNDEYEE